MRCVSLRTQISTVRPHETLAKIVQNKEQGRTIVLRSGCIPMGPKASTEVLIVVVVDVAVPPALLSVVVKCKEMDDKDIVDGTFEVEMMTCE